MVKLHSKSHRRPLSSLAFGALPGTGARGAIYVDEDLNSIMWLSILRLGFFILNRCRIYLEFCGFTSERDARNSHFIWNDGEWNVFLQI